NRIAHLGVSRTFQNTRLFAGLTCLDNVRIAAHQHARSRFWQGALATPAAAHDEEAIEAKARDLLETLGLADVSEARASDLPAGHATAGQPLLAVRGLDVYYGAVHALKGVDLEVRGGEIATLIGANGAGKSTLLRTISGLVRPRAGAIELDGADLLAVPAHDI